MQENARIWLLTGNAFIGGSAGSIEIKLFWMLHFSAVKNTTP
jgi:hypothetical protein